MLDYATGINNPQILIAYLKTFILSSHFISKVNQQEPQLTVCMTVVQFLHSLPQFPWRALPCLAQAVKCTAQNTCLFH